MDYVRRAGERGRVNIGWLDSQHSFSFGHYYDPKHMGFSVLRVINDDVVRPGYGFDEHAHRDMEIISYVVSGALAHKDSTGNDFNVPAGDIQRMSAGKGIRHSEYNPSQSYSVNFLQIWITPDKSGIEPSYEQKTIDESTPVTPLINPTGTNGALSINQDVSIYKLTLAANASHRLTTGKRWGYLHLIKGTVTVEGTRFGAGDAFGLMQDKVVSVSATDDTEALWFDLPIGQS
ncbi:pirin family protein [Alteromonas sp. H39]|uniref:pirin family protein n=1 Tax=Alteromonas sp. H39 TaxID=3389876 RepID=UPI0039DF9149